MSVKQISVFIENKSGGLAAITDELAAEGINLRALSMADNADFGILRLIVDDVFKAGNVLKDHGHVYTITDVIAVAAEDKPGSVAKIISILAKEDISLDYTYAFFQKKAGLACMIIRVADMAKAVKLLGKNGIRTLSEEELTMV